MNVRNTVLENKMPMIMKYRCKLLCFQKHSKILPLYAAGILCSYAAGILKSLQHNYIKWENIPIQCIFKRKKNLSQIIKGLAIRYFISE
jgi:hypothetical protein